MLVTGIALAFIAMLSWGFGDFLVQRSTRRLGDWETLFVITLFGTVVLLPFVWKEALALILHPGTPALILVASALFLTVAAVFNLEGYKKGKLSVLEPLLSFEIISASLLAFFVLGDKISWTQGVMIGTLMIGLMLVSFRERFHLKTFFVEKGVFIFLVGGILMGFADFLLGWGARVTDPILANFVLNITMVIVSGIFMVARGRAGRLFKDIASNRALILTMSVSDNLAWVAYAVAMTLVPIAVATGLSESSTIIAVLLGLFINKERLQRHQKVGLFIALGSVVILAFLTTGS